MRRLTDNGHQTSVVTTRTDLSVLDVAERRFSRWRQENFFRYMRHEFALDHLPTYDVEPGDPERPVPNPAKKDKKKELDAIARELAQLKETYADSSLGTAEGEGSAPEKLRSRMTALQSRIDALADEHRALPSHVPIGQIRDPRTVVQLERERKVLVDQMKMVACRAETELARLVGPLLGIHHSDEARSFLREVFQLPADLISSRPSRRHPRYCAMSGALKFHTRRPNVRSVEIRAKARETSRRAGFPPFPPQADDNRSASPGS